jgi:Holliday junction resolvase RusA-like endonuclease
VSRRVWNFKVDTPVVAKQRARLGRKRGTRKTVAFTPQPTRDFESIVAEGWRSTHPAHEPINEPMHVDVRITRSGFTMKVTVQPASVRPVGIRGDIDNYLKSILDGLNKVAWTDDKLVESVTIVFDGEPRKQRGNRKPG